MQNVKNELNSSSYLPITSTNTNENENENELKRQDLTDRDTGDLDKITTKQQQLHDTADLDKITTKQQQLHDKANKIIQYGIGKCKEILATIKSILKL